jgi:hypothetical protein
MENNYWIVDEWLIFKPDFNDELDDYYNIINKYKKVMFSNYVEPLIAIKTNNIYAGGNKYVRNNFNQKIDLSNNINLTHLTFEWNFNKEIDLSNNINLTHLTFEWNFNKEIDLSNNINLRHLSFKKYFNQEFSIPLNIKSLNIYMRNNQYIIDNLHNNIKTYLNLNNLLDSVKKLDIIIKN